MGIRHDVTRGSGAVNCEIYSDAGTGDRVFKVSGCSFSLEDQ